MFLKIHEWDHIVVDTEGIRFYRQILAGLGHGCFHVEEDSIWTVLALIRYFMETGEIRIVKSTAINTTVFEVVKVCES